MLLPGNVLLAGKLYIFTLVVPLGKLDGFSTWASLTPPTKICLKSAPRPPSPFVTLPLELSSPWL